MYKIVSDINADTKIATNENEIYIAKKIIPTDIDLYKRIMGIDNPYLAKIIDTVIIEDDFYVIEEYVNGVTLSEYVESNHPLDSKEIRNFIIEICNGLKELHKRNIIHRDINPNNIMVDNNKSIKIIDYGISRITKSNQSTDTTILGTQGYAAPEQFGFKQTSQKSDIYSLGVLINYMCTKSLPSEKITTDEYEMIVKNCIQIDENKRYDSVDDIVFELGKKLKYQRYLRTIPGFRKNIWWHKLIAITYYLWVFILAVLFFYSFTESFMFVINIFTVLFIFALPIPIIFNQGNWLNNSKLTRNYSKGRQIASQILLLIDVMLIATFFILL